MQNSSGGQPILSPAEQCWWQWWTAEQFIVKHEKYDHTMSAAGECVPAHSTQNLNCLPFVQFYSLFFPCLFVYLHTLLIKGIQIQILFKQEPNLGRQLLSAHKYMTSPTPHSWRTSGHPTAEWLIESRAAHIVGTFVYCFYCLHRPNNIMRRRPKHSETINNYWACLVSCGPDTDREGRQTKRRRIKASQ